MWVIASGQNRTRHRVKSVVIHATDVTHVCFEADDEAGIVRLYEWVGFPADPGRNPVLKQGTNGHPVIVELRGTVKIILSEPSVPSEN